MTKSHSWLLDAVPDVARLVMEGGGPVADIWIREAEHRGIELPTISADAWRRRFFDPVERRGRDRSKLSADALARRVIAWSGLPRPKSMRHDAAEAVSIGLWGVLALGWLHERPRELR